MHVCDEFRERITERLLDRHEQSECKPDAVDKTIQNELLVCNSCADFYAESKEMIDAFSSVQFDVTDTHLELMADRLRLRILEESEQRAQRNWRTWFMPFAPAFAGAMALLLVIVGLYRFNASSPELVTPVAPKIAESVVPSDPSIDPVTMEFIEQSELLLRSVMKLKSTSVEDLKEAQEIADRHLIAIEQRKQAASGSPTVVSAMDNYETVLRDISHVHGRFAADDIADIKNRIAKTGLIANMKAVQPSLIPVDADVDHEQ